MYFCQNKIALFKHATIKFVYDIGSRIWNVVAEKRINIGGV